MLSLTLFTRSGGPPGRSAGANNWPAKFKPLQYLPAGEQAVAVDEGRLLLSGCVNLLAVRELGIHIPVRAARRPRNSRPAFVSFPPLYCFSRSTSTAKSGCQLGNWFLGKTRPGNRSQRMNATSAARTMSDRISSVPASPSTRPSLWVSRTAQ